MNRHSRHAGLLQEAVAHHTAGRLDAAATLYRRVVAEDPGNADALNLLGTIAHAHARYEEANALYRRALTAAPHVPDIHFNLANLLAATGQTEAAIASYKHALAVKPAFIDAHIGLGVALYERGDLDAAAAHFRDAVARGPQDVRGHVNLGQCLLRLRRADEAVACFIQAANLAPADADIQMLLANAYADAGHLDKALAHARRAVALSPAPVYYSALGDLLRHAQDLDGALAAHESALAKAPDNPSVLYNYGASLHAAKRLLDAENIFKRAVALAPGFINAYAGLAKVYEHRGLFDLAVATLQEAMTRDPASAEIRFKLAILQLSAADLRAGWSNYAFRMAAPGAPHPARAVPPPYWSGEDLAGKTIVVWTEQGLGDEILLASMLPDVIARARACIIECSPRLAPVFARSFPLAQVRAYQRADLPVTPAPDADYQIAIGDVGRFLRDDLSAFPRHHGYLKADAVRAETLRARYQAIKPGNLVVGLSWRSGNKDIGALKSAILATWSAVLCVPGITFVDLQYGDNAADIAAVKAQLGIDIYRDDEIDSLHSMEDFFAQVAAMDLIISTSNTTVHVAGSLNVPVWLIDAGGLWYWFRERSDSPWYPSMRIFRSAYQWVSGSGAAWWSHAITTAGRELEARTR